jgi:hypothetical protein
MQAFGTQGLKPAHSWALFGMAQAMPLHVFVPSESFFQVWGQAPCHFRG